VTNSQLHPEQLARQIIDEKLVQAGWIVQNWRDLNLAAGRGIAVREFPTATGPVDYVLYIDRKAIGMIEAKAIGATLLSVETQMHRYQDGFAETAAKKELPYWALPLPFFYVSTGEKTVFTDRRDPAARLRPVFHFHRPETLLAEIERGSSLRQRLRLIPQLDPTGFRKIQIEAVTGLERCFANGDPRTLVPMTMGSGKTFVAVAESARLIEHAKAKRILFLVDRINLATQAEREFRSFTTAEGRKFAELYPVQVLHSNEIAESSKVVITTIQRLYSMLKGESEFDPELEEESSYETQAGWQDPEDRVHVTYQPSVPIETFDFIFTDECHRSIYGRWGEVLEYFDNFLVGLTATPEKFTYGYFNGNIVAEYTHEQSVIDGVNVGYVVYRIETEITAGGSEIEKGEWVQVRDRYTRRDSYRQLDDTLTYDEAKLDRAVVSKDQIRTVVRTFKDKVCTEMFHDRTEVPKTVFFCKDDNHAEEVLQIIREEFARGDDFARKITYKVEGKAEDHIQDFRTDPRFRIAVSVDQISTGSDIPPCECLVFMRMVRSRSLMEQMKGRGCRTVDPDDLQSVTPDARDKDRFVIVDCVGISDEDRAWAETKPLDREPAMPLKTLMQRIAEGVSSDRVVGSVGARLVSLAHRLGEDDLAAVEAKIGKPLLEVAKALIVAADRDEQITAARQETGKLDEEGEEPTDEEVAAARAKLVEVALVPLLDAEVRRAIEDARLLADLVFDLTSRDVVRRAEFIDMGEAEEVVSRFKTFIDEHQDEYVALKAFYAHPYRDRQLALRDIRELATAIQKPPLNLSTERVWAAYERLDKSKVKGSSKRVLTDIVSLVRYTIGADSQLTPHIDAVTMRFDLWLEEQQQEGKVFTAEQLRWLEMIRDHIATSLSFDPELDFDVEPFRQEGSIDAAYELFGGDLNVIIDELNRELAVA
jgi:type I restriction enzyme R subunit